MSPGKFKHPPYFHLRDTHQKTAHADFSGNNVVFGTHIMSAVQKAPLFRMKLHQ